VHWNIFVHWKIHLCTGKYICALENNFVHWKNIFVHWKIHLCIEKYVINVLRSIFMHWNFYLCIAYMGHRTYFHTHTFERNAPTAVSGEERCVTMLSRSWERDIRLSLTPIDSSITVAPLLTDIAASTYKSRWRRWRLKWYFSLLQNCSCFRIQRIKFW